MDTSVHDELAMPCPQCCRKHLSAAIAYLANATCSTDDGINPENVLIYRAYINLVEASEGYKSHVAYARGLLVTAEEESISPARRSGIRAYRLMTVDEGLVSAPPIVFSTMEKCYAHIDEAEREFPGIRGAVEREPFYRSNMSDAERRQAEINYRLAQMAWLEENCFPVAEKKGE